MEADCARIDIVIPRMAAKADEAVEFLLRVNESRRELNEITEDMTVDGLKHELSKCRGMRRDCVVWWLTNFYNDIRTCTRGIASRLNPLAAYPSQANRPHGRSRIRSPCRRRGRTPDRSCVLRTVSGKPTYQRSSDAAILYWIRRTASYTVFNRSLGHPNVVGLRELSPS